MKKSIPANDLFYKNIVLKEYIVPLFYHTHFLDLVGNTESNRRKSEVLNRNQRLALDMIRKLSEGLKVVAYGIIKTSNFGSKKQVITIARAACGLMATTPNRIISH